MKMRLSFAAAAALLAVSGAAIVTVPRGDASGAATATEGGSYWPAISANGRFVAFESGAANLVSGDTNAAKDVFVRDRLTGRTQRVSVGSRGEDPNAASAGAEINAAGRFVAFTSSASNLVPGDDNSRADVFLRDRARGVTERVSVGRDGAEADDESYDLGISSDGRFVLFASAASNLVPGGELGWNVYVRDRRAGTTERITPAASPRRYTHATISADGSVVAFTSYGLGEIVPGHPTPAGGVFVRDRASGEVELVTEAGQSPSRGPAVSPEGRLVGFISLASDLVPADTNAAEDVFLRDRATEIIQRVDLGADAAEANGGALSAAISAGARFVAFDSFASNLVAIDGNGTIDVFVRDRVARTTERVSGARGGGQPSISENGRFVAFGSRRADGNAAIFVRDRVAGTTELVSSGSEAAPRPLAGRVRLSPSVPRAGRTFTATMPITVAGLQVTAASVGCKAMLAERSLALAASSFRASSARCAWRLPPSASGGLLRGWLSVRTAGGTVTSRFVVRVR